MDTNLPVLDAPKETTAPLDHRNVQLKMFELKCGCVSSYIGGCLVASLTPSHFSAGWGRASLRGPIGGLANGTPR